MNIILVEERAASGQQPEKSFNKGVILVGRDAFECDIPFDNEQFPMVSRKHAELRWENGGWYLVDLNSSYGTFLDGRRINSPEPIAAGNLLQFGVDGPVLRVVWFEVPGDWDAEPVSIPVQQAAAVPSTPKAVIPVKPAVVPAPLPAEPAQPAAAQLDFAGGGRPPFRIAKPSSWLGRDPECDVVIESTAAMVSRKHAELRIEAGEIVVGDNNSFNGTLVNGQRISSPVPLYHNDEIQLGMGGPVLIFNSPSRTAPPLESFAGQRASSVPADAASKTMVFKMERPPARVEADAQDAQLLMSVSFGDKREITVGRDAGNDISLDGLQISKHHAKLVHNQGVVTVEDKNSTNGVFVNGSRTSRQQVNSEDSIQIGTFLIRVDADGNIGVFDTRSKHRIDAVSLTKEVKSRSGGGKIKLLDSISLSIRPNEFVGLLGPSGAGKSTLIEALNGVRPAQSGNVLINNLDLYRHLDSLKQVIGYVPQEDIIHRELTVYRTLFYVAKLRLSRDVSRAEIDQIINEVLDVTGLADSRNIPVRDLSGGQRKRVSIAVELITKPSVIFLDEPTSGLDPATEEKIMRLFRQIAESGRTVIMTTHAMENIRLFDKIVILMRGKLAFYGTPQDALEHLGANSFKELFDRLEDPEGAGKSNGVAERTAEEWKQKFLTSPQYRDLVHEPLKQLGELPKAGKRKKQRLGIFGAIGQWATLSRRYLEVLFKDKLNLFILFAQAPIIALLTFFVMGADQPRDFVYFILSLVAVWFGTSVSAREIIRERPVYKRERMFNLGIFPYLFSKLFVLSIIVGLQCLMLFVPLKFFDLIGLMPMPGELGGIPQFWAMLLTAAVGIAIGLLVSALVKTSEMATSLVPLILIPQLLFSGLIGVPAGVSKAAGMLMPAAWSFDTMKRFSTLDTLEAEGADPRGKTKGMGLYKFIESENEKMIADARKDLEDLKRSAGLQFQGGSSLPEPPDLGSVQKIPDDLSGYVTFLHPWMNEVLNQIVLMLMFGMLVLATLIILRLQDIV